MVSNWLFKLFVGQFLEPAEKMAAEGSFFFSIRWLVDLLVSFVFVSRVGQKRLPRTDWLIG